MRIFPYIATVAFLGLVAGCGGSSLHPVQGNVHFPDGSPLTTGRVVLDGGDVNSGSWGLIHPDGSFQLGTFDVDDGVPPGAYRVYIENAMTIPPANWGDRDFNPKPLIHARFTKADTSGLSYDVPGDSTEWDIVVEKPR